MRGLKKVLTPMYADATPITADKTLEVFVTGLSAPQL
jgi:hypothetical protein